MSASYSGKFRTPEYVAWQNAIHRCEDSSIAGFPRYGGRGIRVCDEWRRDFKAFLAHVGMRPSSGHSLDRIDYDGNYEPGNVRWATQVEQQRNRCDNRLITAFGRTMCLAEWSAETGIKQSTIRQRLDEYGFEAELALTKAPLKPVEYEFGGKMMTVSQLSSETGIPPNSLLRRLRRHDNAEAAVAAWRENTIGKKPRKND